MTDAVANNLLEGRLVLAGYFHALLYAMFRALLFLLLLAALRAWLRRPLLAAVVAGLIIATIVIPRGAPVLTSWLVFGIGGVAVGVWVMIHYGLVALTVAIYVAFVLNASPVTLDPRSWHADLTLYVLGLVAAIATSGYSTARSASVPR